MKFCFAKFFSHGSQRGYPSRRRACYYLGCLKWASLILEGQPHCQVILMFQVALIFEVVLIVTVIFILRSFSSLSSLSFGGSLPFLVFQVIFIFKVIFNSYLVSIFEVVILLDVVKLKHLVRCVGCQNHCQKQPIRSFEKKKTGNIYPHTNIYMQVHC